MKTTITIIIGILGMALIVGLAYYGWGFLRELIFAPEESVSVAPETEKAAFNPALKNPAINYWAGYYIDVNGNIIKTSEAEEEIIGKVNASPIISVLPSPNGIEAIVAFGNPQNPQFSIFNASTTEWRPLGPEIKAVAWHPNNSRMATLETSNGAISLFTTNSNGNGKTKIMDINILDASLDWIAENTILISEKPSALFAGAIWSVDAKNKTVQLAASANGLMFNRQQNETIIFSVTRGAPSLELKTSDLKQTTEHLPFLTLPEKCAINGKNLYCAIPMNISDKTILPDDYLKKRFYSDDTIYKYDLEEKTIQTIFQPSQDFAIDATNLKIIDDKLYFINRYDNYVYSIDLKGLE